MCAEFKTCGDDDLIKRVDKELAQVVTGTQSSGAVSFRVTNPTRKMTLTLHVYARPGNSGAGIAPGVHAYTNETWQLFAAIKDNPETELNPAFVDSTNASAPRQLPDSYDIDDGVKVAHGVVNLDGAGEPTGDIYKVVAIWEPKHSDMSLEERRYWFSKCSLEAASRLATFANGS